jgi:hypothetical protein
MYGLMRAKTCGLSNDEKLRRRMHYCGTCKTLGAMYGARTRFLLNHDAVFLSELLSALSGDDERLDEWQSAYRSLNCLALPSSAGQLPVGLRYAATATLVMTELKVADQLADSANPAWRVADRTFKKSFLQAAETLAGFGVASDELFRLMDDQREREVRAVRGEIAQRPDDIVRELALPTARATGMIFAHGALAVGNESAEAAMRAIGEAFGELVYWLDALDDFKKDFQKGEFNALRTAYGTEGATLPVEVRRRVVRRVRELQLELSATLADLPISRARAELLASRLDQNLSRKLGTPLPVIAKSCAPRKRPTLGERWRDARDVARGIGDRFAESKAGSILVAPRVWLVFVGCLAMAFLFPVQARAAQTPRECFDIGFNLMALGSLVGSLPGLLFFFAPMAPQGESEEQRRRRQSESCWDGCCDASCCECCECAGNSGEAGCCCCECGSCAEGCGSSCEGCGGCGEGCGSCCECGECCSGCDCNC